MIHEGFLKGTAESIHGSLLVVREMLKHTGAFYSISNNTHPFLLSPLLLALY